jgi:hypothetical protein
MTGRDMNNDADTIREIVGAEEEKALVRFRSSGFGERLKQSLAEHSAAPPRPARFRQVLRPVWISLAVLIVLAAAAAWLLRPRAGAAHGGAVIEALFHGLPGLQAIENPPPPLNAVSPVPGSPLERSIASVLSGPVESSGSPGSPRSREYSTIKPDAKPLGLERVFEILVVDRSVERVLADISTKAKEG